MPRMEGLSMVAEENAHLVTPVPGAAPQAPPPPPPRYGSAPQQPAPPPPPPPLTITTQQRASATVTGHANSKPSLKPLNTAQCTSIIDAMKEGTPLCLALPAWFAFHGSEACSICFV